MKADEEKRNITITVRGVTMNDAGTYWCGAESADNKHSNPFFHRLVMIVGESCYSVVCILSKSGPDCRRVTDR